MVFVGVIGSIITCLHCIFIYLRSFVMELLRLRSILDLRQLQSWKITEYFLAIVKSCSTCTGRSGRISQCSLKEAFFSWL